MHFPFSLLGFRNLAKDMYPDTFKELMQIFIDEQLQFENSKEAAIGLDNISKTKMKNEVGKLSEVLVFRHKVIHEVSMKHCKDNHHLPKEIIEQITNFIKSGKIDKLKREDVSTLFSFTLIIFSLRFYLIG